MLANLNSLHPYNDLKRLPHIVKETGWGLIVTHFTLFVQAHTLKSRLQISYRTFLIELLISKDKKI